MAIKKTTPYADGDKKCGAKTRAGHPCKNPAMLNGRCRLHGGLSTGAPKRNTNAVKTGEHQTIWVDALTEEEQKIYEVINIDRLDQVNADIKLTDIRLRRMLHRIKDLQDKKMVVVSHRQGQQGGNEINITEMESALKQIQNIEEAITRVQGHKARLIETKHKLETELGANTSAADNIADFVAATKLGGDDLRDLFEDE